MEIYRPGASNAPIHLRALSEVARASRRGVERPQQAILDAVREVIFEAEAIPEYSESLEPSELSNHLTDPALSRQLIRMMVILSLADGPPSEKQVSLMSAYAAALDVDEPAVEVVGHLARGQTLRFRLAFARRSHLRRYFRNTYRLLGGLLPLVQSVLRFRGVLGEDKALVARFHALEALPVDTLGHLFHRHCVAAEIPFSGERGGFPPGALFHDFAHVLAGYDTTPEGELKAAAFQAGFTKDDSDFFTALFAVLIHTAGINLTPFDMPVLLGRIGQPGLAVEVLRALERGSAMTVDLGDRWNFWEYVDLPIDAVRQRLGIPPRVA